MVGLSGKGDLQYGRLGYDSYPIDLDYLNRQSFGDFELRTEILGVYAKRLDFYFDLAAKNQSSDDVELGLHTIKAASLGIGAGGIADVASDMLVEFIATGALDAETLADLGMMIVEMKSYILLLNEVM